ncbi:STAS domain-containing protein [Mycobacterium cookii]|uniref:Anti-anti-sigma factor n=1 Tax=Mycobacterium cookii TaxID=1775 RepID=A0A7I7KSG2_9MYCO|nr:STAS domain-containing protein [Mycobacterium cookii]MCV7330088.1 STAS domain-containing protein [Mycobacterium cookii]BBX44282.1 anti-anti-sigma factor [Mycobacterium cookii]
MPTLLTLDTARSSDGRLVLTATGEIDLSNVDSFDDALTAAVAETEAGGGMLTVDLSGVEYLDSAAVNAIFPHADHIRLIAHSFLLRVFDVSGLTELADVEDAPPRREN